MCARIRRYLLEEKERAQLETLDVCPGDAKKLRLLLVDDGEEELLLRRLQSHYGPGLELEDVIFCVRYTFATPPLGKGRIFSWLCSSDRFSTRHNWPLGGVYVLHAQKQITPITPVRLRWGRRVGGRLIGLSVPKPVPSPRGVDVAARSSVHEDRRIIH